MLKHLNEKKIYLNILVIIFESDVQEVSNKRHISGSSPILSNIFIFKPKLLPHQETLYICKKENMHYSFKKRKFCLFYSHEYCLYVLRKTITICFVQFWNELKHGYMYKDRKLLIFSHTVHVYLL